MVVLGYVFSRLLAARRDPGLLAERAHCMQHEDATSRAKVLVRLVGLGGAAVPFVVGLDALLGWSPGFSGSAKAVALVLLLADCILSSCALIENRLFSAVVRIQYDRGQSVVSSGPYRWVRHPGYAGGLLACFATPVLLDSVWAFVPALVRLGALVVCTRLEDAALEDELPGRREYAQCVRYCLAPGIW